MNKFLSVGGKGQTRPPDAPKMPAPTPKRKAK